MCVWGVGRVEKESTFLMGEDLRGDHSMFRTLMGMPIPTFHNGGLSFASAS